MKLVTWLFGDFGYDELIAQYQRANPHVTVVTEQHGSDPESYRAYHQALARAISADSPPDVAAVAAEYMGAFRRRPRDLHNLLTLGAGELEDRHLEWKWRQGLTPEGSALIGLGTDIGPMTMCYRRDLLARAGLPSDRDELAPLWSTWEDFISLGQRYTAATGRAFVSSGGVIFEAMVNQSFKRYYELDGTLVYDANRRVKHAWDVAAAAIGSRIAANTTMLTDAWNAGLRDGHYAALPCPPWMRAFIERQAPETAGDWDMALMPERGGNWGGSFLVLPARAAQPEEAFRFVSWLLAPAQQLKVFTVTGNFPSTPELYETPEIQGFSSAFFSGAPIGRLYAASALSNIEPFEGPADAVITDRFQQALRRVESGAESPDQAWDSALAEIKTALDPLAPGRRGPTAGTMGGAFPDN